MVIDTTEPTDVGHFLGCKQTCGTMAFEDGSSAVTMTYEMSQFLKSCVDQYLSLSGRTQASLRTVTTPFLPEDSSDRRVPPWPPARI